MPRGRLRLRSWEGSEMFYDILLKIGAVAFMVIFFGLCIFIHELGHFLAAKWRGLHIVAF